MRCSKMFSQLICSLAMLLALIACASRPPVTDETALQARYRQAIADVRIAEPHEISRDLTAITPANNNLIWKTFAESRYLAVVTWTSWNGYDNALGDTLTLQREVWVTVVPELQNFCKKMDAGQISVALRLEQLLGLPPGNGKTKFVELWVDPADLFRPAPDPEISDAEAELDFPVSARFVKISDAHIAWFKQLKETSYDENGYPWTRLGYTYDWGNPKNEIGLSEFVIRANAVVYVAAITQTASYCPPKF